MWTTILNRFKEFTQVSEVSFRRRRTLFLTLMIFLIIPSNIPAFAQSLESENIEELRKEVLDLRLSINRSSYELWATIFAVLAAAGGIVISTYLNLKSLQSFRKTAEADLFLRLNESIYRSPQGTVIIEAMIASKKTGDKILETSGGPIKIRDLENFLNEVQAACILVNQKLMSSSIAEPGFTWVIRRVRENAEIMEHIHNAQKTYGYYSYGEITNYKFNDFYEEAKYFKESPPKKVSVRSTN